MTENEMVKWHHQLNGHEFEQALGDSEGQGSLRAVLRGVEKSRTRLSDGTTVTIIQVLCCGFFVRLYLFIWQHWHWRPSSHQAGSFTVVPGSLAVEWELRESSLSHLVALRHVGS